ncbi:MAG TPA: hypothetical protein VIV11_34720 [Kofleriaceae bacterium]
MGRVMWFRCSGLGVVACALSGAACAVTATTCPVGTKLTVTQRPEGRAQWCTVADTTNTALPAAGRSYETRLGLVQPTAMPGGIEGPFTSWYASGALQSHGGYKNYGGRSVPEGVWAFWYDNGQRRVLGEYARGVPQGCFAVWDETGRRETGIVEGDQLRVEVCTPPSDDDIVAIEGGGGRAARTPASSDFSLQAMAGPNRFGTANPDQVIQDPAMTLAFIASARKHLGRLRLGPIAGARLGNDPGYMALAIGGTAAWQLPSFHSRIDAEVSADLAAQRLRVTIAERRTQPGVASLEFWSPLPALQVSFAFALSPNLEALASARVDGFPARDVEREVVYCNFTCLAPVQETWRVGGVAYGAALGLRLVLR